MTTETPLVTVGIPVRNGADAIGLVLENLVRQTYPSGSFEVIVGNHDSSDDTVSVVLSFEERMNIRLAHVDRSVYPSRSSVRNRILENARGEILIFIDADILVCDDFISEHAKIHQTPNRLVSGYTFGKSAVSELKLNPTLFETLRTPHISDKAGVLEQYPELRDCREQIPVMRDDPSFGPFSQRPYVWRGFWSCNMSMRREEWLEIGGFDETFVGWGMEDEEFAYRCALDKKELIFARTAWGYHVPHPVNTNQNMIDVRENVGRFFQKYQNGEIEQLYFNLAEHGSMNSHVRNLSSLTDQEFIRQVDAVSTVLQPRVGTRLGICIQNIAAVSRLNLTHAFLPFLSTRTRPHLKQGCVCYSLLGLRFPFEEQEIDEVVIFVDALMFFGETRIRTVLRESARAAKRCVLIKGSLYRDKTRKMQRERFDGCLGALPVQCIEV